MKNQRTRLRSPREILRQDHETLDGLCEDLINRAESGDWRECDAVWDEFSRALNAHMSLEEEALLPIFEAEGLEQARTADQIRREHRDVRRAVERLGVAIQVHELRAEDVRELVEALRRHAEVEDATLYAWVNRIIPPAERRPAAPRPPGYARSA